MRAGELRRRITIQSATESRGLAGGVARSWGTFATVWAAVEPLSGTEFFTQRVEQVSTLSHRVRIRYRSDVTPQMRISWQGRILGIEAVIHVMENRQETHLMCREIG